jgi:hypothetical protein
MPATPVPAIDLACVVSNSCIFAKAKLDESKITIKKDFLI